MNGVKEKFSNEYTLKFLQKFDILVITETHFNIRVKCPAGFTLVGRSPKIQSSAGKGIHGVAVFKNINKNFILDIITTEFIDSVVFRVRDSELILAAMYIPPSNSQYFSDKYFNNFRMLCDFFSNKQLVILGDLNARTSTPLLTNNNEYYATNPDTIVNANGRRVKEICGTQ